MEVLSHKISFDCHNVPASSDYEDFIDAESVEKCKDAVRVGHSSLTERLGAAELVMVASAWTEYATSQMGELLVAVEAETDAPVIIVGRKHFGRINVEELLDYTDEESVNARQESLFHLELIQGVPDEVLENYLDLHHLLCGRADDCPIATPQGQLISYDGGHLTREGALYLADLLPTNNTFMHMWTAAFSEYLCTNSQLDKPACSSADR